MTEFQGNKTSSRQRSHSITINEVVAAVVEAIEAMDLNSMGVEAVAISTEAEVGFKAVVMISEAPVAISVVVLEAIEGAIVAVIVMDIMKSRVIMMHIAIKIYAMPSGIMYTEMKTEVQKRHKIIPSRLRLDLLNHRLSYLVNINQMTLINMFNPPKISISK